MQSALSTSFELETGGDPEKRKKTAREQHFHHFGGNFAFVLHLILPLLQTVDAHEGTATNQGSGRFILLFPDAAIHSSICLPQR
jgi:hypothetical protein